MGLPLFLAEIVAATDMSKILAAVGGTGQEVALACLRLCHMADLEVPKIFVFDSDDFDPDKTKGQSETRSQKLRSLGQFVGRVTGQDELVQFQFVIDGDRQNDNVVSLFSSSNLAAPRVRDLLDLLITTKQQAARITDGFHGEPTVGAIAFADAIGIGAWKDFETKLNEETQLPGEHFVVLTGGTSGGTGPGVLPVLAGEVMNWKRKRKLQKPEAPNVNVSLIVQLPWFRIADREKGDIEFEAMQHNSACLVKQYQRDLEILADRVVLIGLPDVVDRKSSGPNRQPETVHYVNLVSGWLAAELLVESETREKMSDTGVYALSFEDNENPLELTLTKRTDARAKIQLRLRDAVQASSIASLFCRSLAEQCGSPADIALPSEIWLMAERIGAELRLFGTALTGLGSDEEATVTWFRRVCENKSHGSNDPPSIFVADIDKESGWRAGTQRLGLPKQEHNLVGRLICDAKLLEVVTSSHEARDTPQNTTGDTLALNVFLRLKSFVVRELAGKGGQRTE